MFSSLTASKATLKKSSMTSLTRANYIDTLPSLANTVVK